MKHKKGRIEVLLILKNSHLELVLILLGSRLDSFDATCIVKPLCKDKLENKVHKVHKLMVLIVSGEKLPAHNHFEDFETVTLAPIHFSFKVNENDCE